MPNVANNLILENLRVLALADDGTTITGLSTVIGTDFQVVLQRQSGTTFVAASETVTIAEVGATGHYAFSFTPQNTGLYVLYVRELDAATMEREFRFPYEVLSAGSVFSPTFTNAFCAETDIERYAGLTFTAASSITSTEAAAYAEERSE